MAYAIMIQRDDYTLYQYSKSYPQDPSNSNNYAEYLGFIHVLRYLINQHLQDSPIIIYGDSQLVIEQMFGKWEIKDGSYVNTAKNCKVLLPRFTNIKGEWIPGKKNKIAHELCAMELYKKYHISSSSKYTRVEMKKDTEGEK